MVFLSSQISLENLPDLKKEICNHDWFLFSTKIRTKNIQYDDELYHMHNLLTFYPFIHKETLFTYMMSDNYYFKSDLYKVMKNTDEIICTKKIDDFESINDRAIFIPEKREYLIEKIFLICLILLREIILKRILYVNMYYLINNNQ